ncbi:uncharacterized protein LOC121523540 isoform X2 [Cheilinus undulatus]|uniref:uncharacterized protein LOC121523540 isoform X2 n=1 Tax=Cheilinus undulatus TaxID=241271 RepID=UPI001BD2C41C|nr:uncharacterized protein LOC121523540 isoform X2 [Cheilinus undulatus]XP_041664396.1 uncharacterized protein LOC121523540 isoform X2 [Cheilinus undulatus]
MSQVQILRVFVNQRLTAAAEEIFELFERSIAEYEEQLSRSKEENERQQKLLDSVLSPQLRIQKSACTADIQQLLVSRKQAPVQQAWSLCLDQEDTEPPLIKEEDGQGEVYTPKFTFSPVSLKSEDDEENHQSSQFHQFPTRQMETGADWEVFGPEQTRNLNQGGHLQPVIAVKTEDSSELVAEVFSSGSDAQLRRKLYS